MQNRVRSELLKRLYFLNTREWPSEPLILPDEANRRLSEVHERAFEIICVLAEGDSEARNFKQRCYDSVRPDPYGKYSITELLRSACQFAGPTYRRLVAEQAKDEADLQNDPFRHAQRAFIRQLAANDPFAEDTNLEVGGLAPIPKQKVRFDPLGGVATEF